MRQSHDNRGDTILSEGTVSHSPETNAAFFSVRFHGLAPLASLHHHTKGETPYTLHTPVSPCGSPERNQTPSRSCWLDVLSSCLLAPASSLPLLAGSCSLPRTLGWTEGWSSGSDQCGSSSPRRDWGSTGSLETRPQTSSAWLISAAWSPRRPRLRVAVRALVTPGRALPDTRLSRAPRWPTVRPVR